MKQLLDDQAWNRFVSTGRVEDYLAVCKARKEQAAAAAVSGAEEGHADCNQGIDRPGAAYR